MKNTVAYAIIVAMLFLPIVIYVKIVVDEHEFEQEQARALAVASDRIDALEKEIRILKTDMYILQNGYEGD